MDMTLMKMTTGTAMRLLLEANPVPDVAFADAAQGERGQATLTAILDGSVDSPGPDGRRRRRLVPARPRWRVAIPAATLTAALAAGLAVALVLTSSDGPAPAGPPEPTATMSGALAALVADLTVQSSVGQGDAVAVLRGLADVAAAQPTPALGPVEYSRSENWGLDLGKDPHGLSYRSHNTNGEQDWLGSDGASLSIRTWPGGKVPQGNIPVGRSGPSAPGAANFRLQDPATLPASEVLLRQRLLLLSCPGNAPCTGDDQASDIVKESTVLMGSEPLPPATRAAMLRVLADAAASPGPQQAFFDLGSVADRAGHQGVAIAFEDAWTPPPLCPGSSSVTVSGSSSGGKASVQCGPKVTTSPRVSLPPRQPELWVLVFDRGTGALLGLEFAYCKGPLGSHLATGSCSPESYAQYLEIKAVASIPATPTAPPTTNTP